jgi:hypothetical protein
VAGDLDGRRFDAGLFAVVDFQHLDLEFPPFGPARIHPEQHVGPVLALGTPCPGVDLDIAVVAVGFAGEQRLDLHAAGCAAQRQQCRLGFLHDVGIALGLAKLDQLPVVADARLEGADVPDGGVELVALAHDVAGLVGIAPEIGRLRLGGERV